MPKTKLWILVLVLLIATGCALPRFPGDPFSAAPKPAISSEYATVYLYRFGTYPIKTGIVKMYIDDTLAFNAANSSFTWVFVKPGLREFKASWVWHNKPVLADAYFDNDDKNVSIDLKAGETYYINYRTTPERDFTGLGGNDLTVSATLGQESEYDALREMEICGHLSNSYKP